MHSIYVCMDKFRFILLIFASFLCAIGHRASVYFFAYFIYLFFVVVFLVAVFCLPIFNLLDLIIGYLIFAYY